MTLLLIVLQAPGLFGAENRKDGRPNPGTTLYFFWGEGCPHCEEEKAFLRTLAASNPSLIIRDYEVWHDRGNAALFERVMKPAGLDQAAVPATVIGKKIFVGFAKTTSAGIEKAVADCLKEGCPDAVAEMTRPADRRGNRTR